MDQLFWYFNAGGVMMWPLLACSILAIAIIIERAWRLRRPVLIDPAIVDDIQTHVERGQTELALSRYRSSPVLVGRVLCRGLDEHYHASADIVDALTESGQRGLQVLSNNLSVLNIIAKIAPLLGLLGTVMGMIMGFEALEVAGVGKENLAGAIRVALLTTATGLMVAIPTIVAAAYFRSRIRRFTAEFEEILIDVIKTVKRVQSSRSQTAEPAATGVAT